MGISGKTVLITGAARGIGAETARVLASRGATISLVGLEPDQLEKTAGELPGGGHLWFEADVCDQASLHEAFAQTIEARGGLDVCVANAGIANFGTVEKGDPDAWARCVDVNLTGVFRTAHEALPQLIASKGYFLVIASLASFTAPPGMSAYSASKWGAEALATTMRREVGFRGVKVGSCHPSWIDTDLVRDAEHDLASFREMRNRLPWPANGTTSVQECATLIADGIERRKRKIRVPRGVLAADWLRLVVNGPLGDLALRRDAKQLMPQMEAEIDALGRAFSERTERLNEQSPVT